MIARVATKTTNFFHDEHRDEENSHHKRSINSISPGTPIKTTITTNPIDHNILINTCQSLKKMKIDLNRCTAEENNREKLNQLGEIVGGNMHVFDYSELYHASFLSLSSSSVRFLFYKELDKNQLVSTVILFFF
ncbi:unnamed protein product [Rotaria socialis]|uniref:Uncharacterized protein n=1 Tax=Rotaria socialis TaxID=392032 RepID=A0A818TZ40_9BILA|nr:unnamed protein product [Rotaria socialis]CAF3786321.1 unnamed protein product [Rotaria socialis]